MECERKWYAPLRRRVGTFFPSLLPVGHWSGHFRPPGESHMMRKENRRQEPGPSTPWSHYTDQDCLHLDWYMKEKYTSILFIPSYVGLYYSSQTSFRTWLSRLGSFPSLPHWRLSYRWWQKCTGAKVLVHLWLASVTSPCGLVCPPFSVVPRKSPNPELGITHKQFWYKAILPQRQEAPPGQ